MQKELIISTTPQETKIAILEDDELVEFNIERYRSQGIVGNIYKGKVTKVLPGMQSAFVDIGLERDAFLYVSDFFEDIEEYDKIVSTVEDEVAQLQEGGRGKVAPPVQPAPPAVPASTPVPASIPAPAVAVPPAVVEAEAAEPVAEAPQASTIQPLPGESLGEGERHQAAAAGHEEYERRGRDRDRGRRDRDRDRDRRGKKPKIPSFESKSYESRSEERTYSSTLEALPGESLAKLSRRPEPEHDEDKNAPLGAVAEEPPLPPETSSESGAAEPLEAVQETRSEEMKEERPPEESEEEKPSSEDGSARITDRSENYPFAHRSSGRRNRRGRGAPPPVKTESIGRTEAL